MFKVGETLPGKCSVSTNTQGTHSEALGIAYPAKGTFWTTRGIPPIWPDELVSAEVNSQGVGNEDYLVWVQYVLGQKNPPLVISTSYDDDEQTVPFVSLLSRAVVYVQY